MRDPMDLEETDPQEVLVLMIDSYDRNGQTQTHVRGVFANRMALQQYERRHIMDSTRSLYRVERSNIRHGD
jgi:hypothetical protein